MSKWRDMEYLAKVAGDRTVPVEVGENYLVEGWGQQLMLVSDLIKLTVAQKVRRAPTQGNSSYWSDVKVLSSPGRVESLSSHMQTQK